MSGRRGRRAGKTAVLLVMVASLGLSSVAPATAGSGFRSKVVGTDPAGDWGDLPALAPIGDALGQDIIEASIAKPDARSLRFTMTFTNLPDHDPRLTGVYAWPFKTRKGTRSFINCGALGANECEDPENFAVIGECDRTDHPVLGSHRSELDCERLGEVASEVDRATNSISVDIPLKMINARPGQVLDMKERWVWSASPAFVIAGGGDSEGNSWGTYLNLDILEIERNYRIPR